MPQSQGFEDLAYFARRNKDRHRLQEILEDVDLRPRFCDNSLTERYGKLLGKAGRGTQQYVEPTCRASGNGMENLTTALG